MNAYARDRGEHPRKLSPGAFPLGTPSLAHVRRMRAIPNYIALPVLSPAEYRLQQAWVECPSHKFKQY
jgi:hypothetical protein